mgnify:CR=1 FL=1
MKNYTSLTNAHVCSILAKYKVYSNLYSCPIIFENKLFWLERKNLQQHDQFDQYTQGNGNAIDTLRSFFLRYAQN